MAEIVKVLGRLFIQVIFNHFYRNNGYNNNDNNGNG